MSELPQQPLLGLFPEDRLSGPELLHYAIETHKPHGVFALFSGGHDSLVATHVAMSSGLATSVVHIDTGVGLEATREYIYKTCDKYSWPLRVYRARWLGQHYDEIVEEFGFPGPSVHATMYIRLKERALYALSKESGKRGSPICLISGARSSESNRRMGNVHPLQIDRKRLWVAICHDWTANNQDYYIKHHGLPRSPVKEKICMSGECLCGAFADPGELRELQYWFPDDPTVEMLTELQASEKGKGRWGWDEPLPPMTVTPDCNEPLFEGLCVSCNARLPQPPTMEECESEATQ